MHCIQQDYPVICMPTCTLLLKSTDGNKGHLDTTDSLHSYFCPEAQ